MVCDHFDAAYGSVIAWRMSELGGDGIAGEGGGGDVGCGEGFQAAFLGAGGGGVDAFVDWGAEFLGLGGVEFAGIAARAGGHFGGEETQDEAILVGGPNRAVGAQKAGAGAFLAAETECAIVQAVDEPFEADGPFYQLAVQLGGYAVDQAAGNHGFSNCQSSGPVGPVREQVADRCGEIMVRVHQAAAGAHNAVAVGVGVVSEGDVET